MVLDAKRVPQLGKNDELGLIGRVAVLKSRVRVAFMQPYAQAWLPGGSDPSGQVSGRGEVVPGEDGADSSPLESTAVTT